MFLALLLIVAVGSESVAGEPEEVGPMKISAVEAGPKELAYVKKHCLRRAARAEVLRAGKVFHVYDKKKERYLAFVGRGEKGCAVVHVGRAKARVTDKLDTGGKKRKAFVVGGCRYFANEHGLDDQECHFALGIRDLSGTMIDAALVAIGPSDIELKAVKWFNGHKALVVSGWDNEIQEYGLVMQTAAVIRLVNGRLRTLLETPASLSVSSDEECPKPGSKGRESGMFVTTRAHAFSPGKRSRAPKLTLTRPSHPSDFRWTAMKSKKRPGQRASESTIASIAASRNSSSRAPRSRKSPKRNPATESRWARRLPVDRGSRATSCGAARILAAPMASAAPVWQIQKPQAAELPGAWWDHGC